MPSSDLWDAETAEYYDASSAFMFSPEVLDPAVDFFAELARGGRALEMAIGTGRVARDRAYAAHGFIPLAPSTPSISAARRLAALADGYRLDDDDDDRTALADLLVPRTINMC